MERPGVLLFLMRRSLATHYSAGHLNPTTRSPSRASGCRLARGAPPTGGDRTRRRCGVTVPQREPRATARIDIRQYFDIFGNVDTEAAVRSLAALAQDSRLEVFRLLVQAGPEGLSAGEIAERLGIPASTLSFHVKALAHAGLVGSRQESRFIYYSANFATMNGLIAFLGENCCGGRGCDPSSAADRRSKPS
jgi:DNA-binding transcriptional ArsR family regulator